MNNGQFDIAWSVWINYDKKEISIKEVPSAKRVFFENKDVGMKEVMNLVSKGYKIG